MLPTAILEYLGEKNSFSLNDFDSSLNFTARETISGINFPAKEVLDFSSRNIPLGLEKEVVEIARMSSDRGYIIGTHEQDPNLDSTKDHELRHGLWANNPEYRNKVKADIIPKIPLTSKILIDSYLKRSYHKAVHTDETQAHAGTIVDTVNNYHLLLYATNIEAKERFELLKVQKLSVDILEKYRPSKIE